MSRKIKIVTSSMAMFENIKPPFNLREPEARENTEIAKSILQTAASYKPDLVLLPETFKTAGMSSEKACLEAEYMEGETVSILCEYAKKGNYNLIAGMLIKENKKIYNKAIIIGRDGKIIGAYSKNFPTEGEIIVGISPSDKYQTFSLDFAKIGVGICFDINWENIWEFYNKEGAEIFAWISAYEGGSTIRNVAVKYKKPFVSSVMPYFARVIEIDGSDIVSTSRWNRIAVCEMNLDRKIFHTDLQMNKIDDMQKKYADKITLKVLHEEHLFIVENNMNDRTIDDIVKEFELISYDDYIARCAKFRNEHL